MSRVVRCYGTKRRALVGGVSAGASSMVNDLVEDALEFSTSTVRQLPEVANNRPTLRLQHLNHSPVLHAFR